MIKRRASLEKPFGDSAHSFEERGYVTIPVFARTKKPAIKKWAQQGLRSSQERLARQTQFAECNIGLLAGWPVSGTSAFGFVDVDHPGFVEFTKAVLTPFVSGKIGEKGLTAFCQIEKGLKSTKMRPPGATAPVAEIFSTSGMTVVPRSIHPSGKRYRDEGKSLLEVTVAMLRGVGLWVVDHSEFDTYPDHSSNLR